jgi:multidrug resistance efflux pump
LNFLVVGTHEFSHGLTCTRFGGEVHEMGCALIFFQPAFYCNVSDAWLFPEKSKRLWVGFAGPYFELFLWSLAVLMWRATEPDTWINFITLSVMATSGVKTLLNFNPLIKLDGYYLLSDYLEMPNLRRRSFRYVGSMLEKLFGVEPLVEEEDLSRRERTIYAIYGTAALAGSFSILVFIFLTAGGALVDGRSPTAVLATLGFLGMRYRRRLRRMFGKRSGLSDSFDDEDFETPEKADDLNEAVAPKVGDHVEASAELEMSAALRSVERAVLPRSNSDSEAPDASRRLDRPGDRKKKKSRRRGRWARRTVWLALAAGAAFALVRGRAELRVAGSFNVLPIENSDVRAAVDGLVDDIYVQEGDYVREGEPIARLTDIDTRAALEKTDAQLAEAYARLRMQQAGPTAQEIEVAKAAVATLEDQLMYAQNRVSRLKGLTDEGLLSKKDFEDAQDPATATANNLSEAQARLRALLTSVRPEQIDQTEAQLKQLNADRNHLEEQRRRLTVFSQSTGIVATPTLQLRQLKHQLVKKGDLIAKIYDLRTVTAQIAVDERDIADVHVNQKVVLRARAYPDEVFYGTVNFVSTSALGGAGSSGGEPGVLPTTLSSSSSNAKRTILVTTQIDNHSLLLKPEMSGQAKILCGSRRALDLVTRRLAHTVKVEFWSWW